MKRSCFLLLFIGILSCHSRVQENSQVDQGLHKAHNKLSDNFAHKNITILDTVFRIDDSLSPKFMNVLNLYFEVSKLLSDENTEISDVLINEMNKEIKAIPFDLFNGKEKTTWAQHSNLFQTELAEMVHIRGIENKRSYFSHLSEIMYCTVKSFSFYNGPVYVMYCATALNGKGAYWLSRSATIENPYFRRGLSDCGKIMEKI